MITYLGKFLPNLSAKMHPYIVFSRKSPFGLLISLKVTLLDLKAMITQCPTLKNFNAKLLTKVSSDASTQRLGTLLNRCMTTSGIQ